MTTSTFSVSCPADQWTEVAAGADYSSVSLQTAYIGAVQVAVAASAPAGGTSDFVLLNGPNGPLLPLTLASGDIVYARGLNGAVVVRGIRSSAA